MAIRIDSLQYCDLSLPRLHEMRAGGLDAVHVTICYHEDFRRTVENITHWNDLFIRHSDLIQPGYTADDIHSAKAAGRTAIFFGLQNSTPMEGDIRLLEVLYALGVRFMQLTYNQQSLLAGGCFEDNDSGVSRIGREVIGEMNRLGLVVNMSHAGERSVLEAIEISPRPIAVTHANPAFWHETPRNLSSSVLRALAQSGGMLGFSLYPHHLLGGSSCDLQSFCEMVAATAEIMGVENLGIGSDLCRGRPNAALAWMRDGRWRRNDEVPAFPPQPKWFESAADFPKLGSGLAAAGFNEKEVDGILGENWLRFFSQAFSPRQ